MSYWVIQAITACIIFSGQFFGPAQSYKFDLYPQWAVFTLFIINTGLFICLTHFVIRSSIKYQQQNDVSAKKLALTIFTCLLISSIIDTATTLSMQNIFTSRLNAIELSLYSGNEYLYDLQQIGAYQPRWMISAIFPMLLPLFILYTGWTLCYLFLSTIRNRLQIKSKIKSGQLALLMSQLNPHFLFNSMNSIRGMLFEDKQLASELVDKLTELFRYNLNAKQKFTESLSDELTVCEFYLDIEQTRLEERLLIEIFIEPELEQKQIPTMGLLTLLENAIKHGIAPRAEQSLLTIKAFINGDNWQIKVTNPLYHGKYKPEGTGTGLTNLKQRLELMYGDKAGITVSQDEHLFSAILTLPFKDK